MVGAIILGGATIVGGYLSARQQAKAAEKASETQVEGTREARAYGEPLYAEARRVAAEQLAQGQQLAAQQHAAGQGQLAPYTQAGAGGIGALQQFLGVPTPPGARAATAASMAPPPVAAPTPAMAPLSAVGRGAPPPPLEPAGRPGQPTPATESSYVLLRAPTGETSRVPAAQADFFVARGATRI